jgi:hypothetical protein
LHFSLHVLSAMSGPNSLAYKLLWKGSEKFGSLVPAGGAAQARGAPASTGGFDDEEDDDADTGASASASAARKRAATSQDIDDDEDEDEAPARRVHTTLTSDEDNDDDADVELVKAATEKVHSRGARSHSKHAN